MRGRVCIVTGASSGIGLETARALARLGATVGMVCRDAERGEAARADVVAASRNEAVDLLMCDLASQRQVRDLAAEVQRRYDRVDVLVNNAGIVIGEHTTTEEGIETTFAVNHLAHFLLTRLLAGMLESTPAAGAAPLEAPPTSGAVRSGVSPPGPRRPVTGAAEEPVPPRSRIINVTSFGHWIGRIRDLEDLARPSRYRGLVAYNRAKRANVLFTYELARRLDGARVTANCVNPGAVATRFGLTAGLGFRLLIKAGRPVMVGPARGARASIYLASSPDVEGLTGKYFRGTKPRWSAPQTHDPELARRLWEFSEELCGVHWP